MTYSIVARDPGSGEMGVAVQSQAFNTGAAVPWARPGVGAVATQSFTDRRYGWRGLELMASGGSPAESLERLRADDTAPELRQVGMMDIDGRFAQWTGEDCVPAAGGASGTDWVAQANMVDSPRVWEAMGEVFAAAPGTLAERLMAALEAAEAKGGDWRGRGGAAIVVVPGEGEPWERVIDLRVEEGDGSLLELRRLLTRALGYRAANRADPGDRVRVAREAGLPEQHILMLSIEDAVDREDLQAGREALAQLERQDRRWREFVRTLSKLPDLAALRHVLDR